MSNGVGKYAGQKKQIKSALQRLDDLEQNVAGVQGMAQNLLMATNQVLSNFEVRINTLQELCEAMGTILGAEQVETALLAIRNKRLEESAAKAKAALDKAIEKGEAVQSDTITDKSLLVGQETDKDGKVVAPGRMQITFASLKPDYKELLLGGTVGAVIDTPNGGKFTVSELYEILTEDPADGDPDEQEEEALAEALQDSLDGDDAQDTE